MNRSLTLNDDKNYPDGKYLCQCAYCKAQFKGHKHYAECRECYLAARPQTYIGPIGAHEGDDHPHDPLSEEEMRKLINESNNAIATNYIEAALAIKGLRPEVRHHLQQALTIQKL